jgi:hypothetical protein
MHIRLKRVKILKLSKFVFVEMSLKTKRSLNIKTALSLSRGRIGTKGDDEICEFLLEMIWNQMQLFKMDVSLHSRNFSVLLIANTHIFFL